MPITMQNLKDHMRNLIQFGEMEVKVSRYSYGQDRDKHGYKILVSNGNLNPYTIYTDDRGVIVIVEHANRRITSINAHEIRLLCELVNVQIWMGDQQ